jgi:hypothetical protein
MPLLVGFATLANHKVLEKGLQQELPDPTNFENRLKEN